MQIQITQPSIWKRIFLVQIVNGNLLGEMKYVNAFVQAQAEIESINGNWIIRKKSFWSREIQVIEKNSQIILSSFFYNQWKREMKCTLDYNNFIFRSKGLWQRKYTWENDKGEMLLEYIPQQGLKFNSTATVAGGAEKLKQFSLLVFIGLYQLNAIRTTRSMY